MSSLSFKKCALFDNGMTSILFNGIDWIISFCMMWSRKFYLYLKNCAIIFVNNLYSKKMCLPFCQSARSGTFACYGDMTVTMDKINSKTDGPIDGKKGYGRLLMIINRILFFSSSRLIKFLYGHSVLWIPKRCLSFSVCLKWLETGFCKTSL